MKKICGPLHGARERGREAGRQAYINYSNSPMGNSHKGEGERARRKEAVITKKRTRERKKRIKET